MRPLYVLSILSLDTRRNASRVHGRPRGVAIAAAARLGGAYGAACSLYRAALPGVCVQAAAIAHMRGAGRMAGSVWQIVPLTIRVG